MYRYGTLRDGEVAFPEEGGQVLVYTDANGVPQPDPGGGGGVQSEDIDTIVVCTQAEYDAIPSPVATTMYVIVG